MLIQKPLEKGEDIAQKLYSIGYLNLITYTRHSKEKFTHLHFIKKVMSSTGTRPFDVSNFRNRHWFKDLESAVIRFMRIDDPRHTYTSLFVMNGGEIYDLKTVLGHSDMKTTERYAHLSNDHLAGIKDIIKPQIGAGADIVIGDFKAMTQDRSRSIHTPTENTNVANF